MKLKYLNKKLYNILKIKISKIKTDKEIWGEYIEDYKKLEKEFGEIVPLQKNH